MKKRFLFRRGKKQPMKMEKRTLSKLRQGKIANISVVEQFRRIVIISDDLQCFCEEEGPPRPQKVYPFRVCGSFV